MPERQEGRTSQLWRGARRGAGWALGFGAVIAASRSLQHGWRPTARATLKGVLRLRQLGAEAAEQVQDLYAEAESEYVAETYAAEDG